jgi:hypothetical protein
MKIMQNFIYFNNKLIMSEQQMNLKSLEELKVNKKEFEIFKNKLNEQSKMRKFCVKNIEKYLKTKQLFSPTVDVHIKKIGKRADLDIWVVDGGKVRSFIDIDFTTGGHGIRYLYIPMNEIWIDSATDNNEIDLTILHEITEFNLMKKGTNYNDAHDIACVIESIQRDKRNGKLN